LFLYIETLVPITLNGWKQGSTLLSENFAGRTSDAIRRKFNALVRAKPSTGDPDCPWMVRTTKKLLAGIRKKCELETESDFEIQDSESEDDNLLEPKATGTDSGIVNENVEAIVIDNNQENDKSTGNGKIDLDKSDLSVRKKCTSSKRKELPKVSRILHFNDMPFTPLDRLKDLQEH